MFEFFGYSLCIWRLAWFRRLCFVSGIALLSGCSVTTRVIEKVELRDYEQSTLPNIREKDDISFSLSGGGSWYGDQKYVGTTQDAFDENYGDTIYYRSTPGNFTVRMQKASFDLAANFYLKFISLHAWMMDDRFPSPRNYGYGISFYRNFKYAGFSFNGYSERKHTTFDMWYFENVRPVNYPDTGTYQPKIWEDQKLVNRNYGTYIAVWSNSWNKWGIIPYAFFGGTENDYQMKDEEFDQLKNHRYTHGLGVKYNLGRELSFYLTGRRNEIVMEGGGSDVNYFISFKSELNFNSDMFGFGPGK